MKTEGWGGLTMKGWAGILLAAFLLSGCAGIVDKAGSVLDVGLETLADTRDEVREGTAKSTVLGAKTFCGLSESTRADYRKRVDAEADSDSETAGMRVRITGGPCGEVE